MMLKSFVFLLVGIHGVGAFISQDQRCSSLVPSLASPSSPTTALCMAAIDYDFVVDRVDHYEVRIPKPLGVVFGENPDPYYGLVIDDVSEGLNGGKAGLRIGDQLMAINEQVVVGKDFDTVMGMLQAEPTTLNLVMYRGPASQLFTVISNQLNEDESIFEDDDDEGEEEVIMDENYESPVRIEVKEEKPLTPGDFVKAFGKLGSMLGETVKETLAADPNEGNSNPAAPQPPKKKTGFFGIGGEAVQLDSEDARGYRLEKIEPDEF